jgi:Domain of unknown function (DUF4375)
MDDNEQTLRKRSSDTINRVVLAIYDSFGQGTDNPLELLSPELKVVLLCDGFFDCHELGGIDEWYYNPYGEFATETIAALNRLGCSELATALQRILSNQLSLERLSQPQRGHVLKQISRDDLMKIDKQLAELRAEIPQKLVDFITKHGL